MKASLDFIKQLEQLLDTYEKEIEDKVLSGILAENTAKTYLVHSDNFVRWCRDDFVPGARNEK